MHKKSKRGEIKNKRNGKKIGTQKILIKERKIGGKENEKEEVRNTRNKSGGKNKNTRGQEQ